MTPEGSFEPTVIFFGLTNSPVTFQVMINKILRDLINTGKVAAFIDDIIVGTESEKEHNELVEEIIKRLEENNLYVKLEKCKWKVKKVSFLEVVIGPECCGNHLSQRQMITQTVNLLVGYQVGNSQENSTRSLY